MLKSIKRGGDMEKIKLIDPKEINELYKKVGLNPKKETTYYRTELNKGTLNNKLITRVPENTFAGKLSYFNY